jgi:hypothetical protein
MEMKLLKKLRQIGAIEHLDAGVDGVRVSLQCRLKLTDPSRTGRRNILKSEFERIARDLSKEGAKVDLDSISVSGQTVEAVLPLDKYDHLTDALSKQDVRVDPVTTEQITQVRLDP